MAERAFFIVNKYSGKGFDEAVEGQITTVDRVTYDDDPPWPAAADGLGASLQLVDASQDNARASNWSDGSGWQFFSYTGEQIEEFHAAVKEFQEQTIIPFTQLKGTAWLDALGLNPTLEALSVQALVILAALATYSVVQRNARLTREDKAMRAAKP